MRCRQPRDFFRRSARASPRSITSRNGCTIRALLVHNYYGSSAPSGENQVFELEKALLERNGHTVSTFVRSSDEVRGKGLLGALQGAAAIPWNPWSAHDIRRRLAEFPVDVVHAHNTFPLISPSIFGAVGARAARVLTLHNFRLFCPAAIPLREGRPCTDCIDRRSITLALVHGCYRGSRVATLPLAASVALHRWIGTWRRNVDAFIALTEFQRDVLVSAGLPERRVFVKPNFYPGKPQPRPWAERQDRVVFAGRLSDEKGVSHLIDAWRQWGPTAPELRVLGDGPLRAALEAQAAKTPGTRVSFLGQVASAAAEHEIATAKLVVLPSICFEGFPMVLREAFAFATPAAVSHIGPLPRIVQDGTTGVVFQPGDARSLLERVRAAWYEPGRLEEMSRSARGEYEARYAEPANYDTLMHVYRNAISFRDERVAS